ncbi:MAG: hydantoinase B/oxoprolinase family protein, partial [Alphaproteobacteria bacterium]|nr:hydantoinase B/oxoprolinase family protein [Alphaproteobacteria bacterium]
LRTLANEPIYPGESFKVRAPGGGGWGDPLDRSAESVWRDVIDGLVTPERARNIYGVVVGPDGMSVDQLQLDDTATASLRASRKSQTIR